MQYFRKTLVATAALAASLAVSSPAFAAATINPDGSVTFDTSAGSNTVNVSYNGLGGDPKALTTGLTAYLTLTFTGVVNNVFTFDYTLQNTSTVDGTRISGIGFDTSPDVVGVTSTGVFDLATLGGTFASIGSETCFNGGPGTCPESNPGNSILFGGSGSGTLSFTLGSPSGQSSITLGNFLDRYQGFSTTNVNGAPVTSAVGLGTPAAVPEPATWGLMLLGFGGMGIAIRRRRKPGLLQIA